jgi:hypothetical protein
MKETNGCNETSALTTTCGRQLQKIAYRRPYNQYQNMMMHDYTGIAKLKVKDESQFKRAQ